MKNFRLILFVFFQLYFYSFASGQSINDMGDSIVVNANKYLMIIEKKTAELSLKNPNGHDYTQLPLSAYASPSLGNTKNLKYFWAVNGSDIELNAMDSTKSKEVMKGIVRCYSDNFEIQFAVLPPSKNSRQISYSQQWGTLGLDVSVDRHILSIGGKKYTKGLGTHAYSNITLDLNGSYSKFLSDVGVDDEVGDNGTVVFQVFTDGSKVYDSGLLYGSSSSKAVEVSLENVNELKLIVTTGGDNNRYDHADWAVARLVKPNGETVYISDLIENLKEQVNIFCSNQDSVSTRGWKELFTSEPDRFYYDGSVAVDLLRTDGKRYFAPAPLNLSFLTSGGWLSVGLCKLPDATRFAFENNRFTINYAWSKMHIQQDSLYWITPLCFTFNRNEWQGIADYRNYLINHNYIADRSIKERNIPRWWMKPLVCTWGEQVVGGLARASQGFTTDWVKNYVDQQEKKLGYDKFTLIIDDKWQKFYGDPNPDPYRFTYLRSLIHKLHARGHHVILWWMCWHAESGSLPDKMGITDNGIIDATNPNYINYVKQSVYKMLSSDPGCLNADGFKMDYIFDIRDPVSATGYADPSLGIGLRELYRYIKVWYDEAKKIKPQCLITFSGPDPHFADVQDMTRLNDGDGNHYTTHWQNRTRVSSLAAPNLLIDGDGCEMYADLILPNLVNSSVYGLPSLYFMSRYSDGKRIPGWVLKIVGRVFSVSAMKRPGNAIYLSPGRWQMRDDKGLIAESMQQSSSLIVYPDSGTGYTITVSNQKLVIPIHGRSVAQVIADSEDVPFSIKNDNLIIPSAVGGQIYQVKFGASSIHEGNSNLNIPDRFCLKQNYPNPFNIETTINYDLPKSSLVFLDVYNLMGEKVRQLVNSKQPAGRHEAILNGMDLASGIYFYRLKAGNFIQTKKMVLLR